MNPRPIDAAQALRQLDDWSAVIDVRSPSEFALDHMPGAVNWPVLDDEQRERVGTLYTQVDPFSANKIGAALIARNIADHLDRHAADLPKSWRPLVYCWRGGNRSGAMAHILARVGFSVTVVQGGYRELRRVVLADLDTLPARLRFRVICGATGCGKSRLLAALREAGAQVLDLERLANHFGSVLGLAPGAVQPPQKLFDTALWDALRRFDPAQPVFVEAESGKIGALHLPRALFDRLRGSDCVRLELPDAARIELLLQDYAALAADLPLLHRRLDSLRALRGNATVDHWQQLTAAGALREFTADILARHYDPSYSHSQDRLFARFATAEPLQLRGIDPDEFAAAARYLLQQPALVSA